jgi:hypothetical protein
MKRVVKALVTMILLKYPIGMQKLPLWEKFGLNPPMGGFLEDSSREVVLFMLSETEKNFLNEISNNDPLVKEISKDLLSRPDLTEEQIEEQSKRNQELMKNFTKSEYS